MGEHCISRRPLSLLAWTFGGVLCQNVRHNLSSFLTKIQIVGNAAKTFQARQSFFRAVQTRYCAA